ncbi:zinc finger, CCHC-type containing protein [Tanacetum coccineum]
MTSPSSPPPSLLPSSSHKRSRSSLPLLSPSPSTTTVPPPPEHIESVRNDIETLRASLVSVVQEMMTLLTRVGSLEQHDVVTRESLRIVKGRITRSPLRAKYANSKTLFCNTAKQDVRELREFQVTERFEMAELRSRVLQIEASFWDLERHLASNWLERLPAGSITTWEDLTIQFLAQFFPPGRTAKLRNDILMFQQHHGESLSEAWTRFKDLLQNVPHHGIDRWLQI